MQDLSGWTVWITGAGSGIGRAMAQRFATAGCTVALTGRTPSTLDEVAATLEGRGRVYPGDVLDRPLMAQLAERIAQETGRLDVVCNNAGTNVPRRTWDDVDWDAWDRVIDINVKGAMGVIAAAVPVMRAGGGGVIVTTSSWAGRFHSPKAGVPYGASKHAVTELSRSVNSSEGAYGIRACALHPAEVATELLKGRPGWTPQMWDEIIQPDDMAEAALFAAQMNPNVAVHEITLSPVRR